MKTTIQLSHLIRIGSLLLVLAAAVSPARAATTGQWDFDAGDLTATIGVDLAFRDSATQNGTQFGTTTTFGIANINGEVAKVMKFPKTITIDGGYAFYSGANANGGGNLVNQYTIVMDVYFPSGSSGKNRALVQTDAGGNAEFFVSSGNGIGADGGPFTGNVTPDEWHRLAFAVDLAADPAVVAKFIDGVKVGEDALAAGPAVDSHFAISLFDAALFNDDSGETEVGYINSLQIRDEKMSDVSVGALGGPTAAGILSGPPPNPYFVSLDPSPETARIPSRSTVSPQPQIQVVIEDGQTALDTTSVRLQIDGGSIVTPTAVKVGTTTTVTYTPPGFLSPGIHRASITFADDSMPPKSLGTQWQFAVGPYVGLPAEAAGPLGSANTPGFLVRTAQASTTNVIPNVNSFGRAIRQLNGTLTDADGVIVPNLAFAGPNPDGSYNADTINFHLSGPDVGVFTSDQPFPGIPGIEGSRNVFATEVVGFLELTAGVHHLGVSVSTARTDSNDDDGYTLYSGKDARNILSTVVGSFFRGNDVPAFATSFTTNDFTIVAPVDGVYSYRLVHFQNGDDASLEFYSIDDATGQKILINDPADGRAIKAYRFSTAPFSNKPYVAQIDPTPGGSGVSPLLPIQVLVIDALTQVDLNSIQLSLNGTSVSAATSKVKVNGRTTINYQPNATRTNPTNQLHLVYSDNSSPSALSFTNDWAFTSAINAVGQNNVSGQWDFNFCDLSATIGKPLQYFDGPNGATAQNTVFGTCASLGVPLINGQNANIMQVPGDTGPGSRNLAYIMDHGIKPNGGGTRVNQYTLIYDVMIASTGAGAASMLQVTDPDVNVSDGDLFWQGNNFGQGANGYIGTGAFTPGAWHRVIAAYDEAATPPVVTKYEVDGVKQDDWTANQGLDNNRRAMLPTALLFADGDQDERRQWWVSSVQVREGKLTDAQMAALGGPSANKIPVVIPETTVTGQWDFDQGNLAATVGKALQYFDGPTGDTATKTTFGTCSSMGVALINGEDAHIMHVPGDTGPGSRNLAYIMDHGIKPNGGGTRVNQYTLIYDVMVGTTGAGAASMLQVTDPDVNLSDGDLFWQGNNFGQGANGYIGTGAFTPGAWHRVIAAYDEAATPPVVTKYVDGIKQDDWTANQGLDNNRRAMLPTALLFADGDQDERREWWVNSVQVRSGKLSDAEMAALGGPSASGIPVTIPPSTVTGQWDFNQGNLTATVGKALQYFDGPTGATATKTTFGTCSSMGVALINGVDANIMHVPGDTGAGSRNLAYIMDHGIKPNGGGTRVNQYTLIFDVMVGTTGAGAASMLQVTDPDVNLSDGDLFWQGNNFGQGGNGYIGTGAFTPGAWHRVIAAYDEAAIPPVVTKYVDGIFQDDWTANQGLDNNRRAMLPTALLFADGDQDERREWWVDSIQVRAGALSKAEMAALGGASGSGIPVAITLPLLPPAAKISSIVAGSNLRLSWPASLTGFTLESTPSLSTPNWQSVGGVVGNCASVPISAGPRFYRLRQ